MSYTVKELLNEGTSVSPESKEQNSPYDLKPTHISKILSYKGSNYRDPRMTMKDFKWHEVFKNTAKNHEGKISKGDNVKIHNILEHPTGEISFHVHKETPEMKFIHSRVAKLKFNSKKDANEAGWNV